MVYSSRVLALLLALCIAIITTLFLSLFESVGSTALIVAFFIGFSVSYLLIFVVLEFLIFREINSRSIIDKILDLAGYTYGPLLGLFAFGILTRRQLPDHFIVVLIALASPVICYFMQLYSPRIINGYVIGIEILLVNGIITFLGLLAISNKSSITIQTHGNS